MAIRNAQDELNRCMPVAKYVRLGDLLAQMITNVNALLAERQAAAPTSYTGLTAIPTFAQQGNG